MTTDYEDAERDVIAQRAAQWLTQLSANNPLDRPAFVRWLKKSPRHVEEFLLMSAVCKSVRNAQPAAISDIEQLIVEAKNVPSNIIALTPTADERDKPERAEVELLGGQRADPGADTTAKKILHWPSIKGPAHWAAVVAGIASLGLGAIWATPRITTHLNTYTTKTGEQRTVPLPDGSVIYMNAQSRFTVNYSAAARDIELLNGEAIFKVERVPNRPFRVHTRAATIQAVGTQFNVYQHAQGNTVVSVLDGAVRVSKTADSLPAAVPAVMSATMPSMTRGATSGATSGITPAGTMAAALASTMPLRLSAGEEAQVAASGAIVKRNRADLSRTTAWRERRLVFHEERLQDIAAEFSRYSPHRIVLSDEAARNKRITGTFDADDPESLVQFLSKLGEFSVQTTADGFTVRGR